VAAVKAACGKEKRCAAFVMHTSGEFDGCGYLKSAAGPTSAIKEGFQTYIRASAGAGGRRRRLLQATPTPAAAAGYDAGCGLNALSIAAGEPLSSSLGARALLGAVGGLLQQLCSATYMLCCTALHARQSTTALS